MQQLLPCDGLLDHRLVQINCKRDNNGEVHSVAIVTICSLTGVEGFDYY